MVPAPGSTTLRELAASTSWERHQEHQGQMPDDCAVPVLGLPLRHTAPALHALTDFAEMVISLVHPLVQVYTIPTTGEFVYAGHMSNFRQHVSSFPSSLPVLPRDVPFILVRARRVPGQTDTRPIRNVHPRDHEHDKF